MIQVVPTESEQNPQDIVTMGFLNLSRDEVATIWYALQGYKESLLTTAKESVMTKIEDEAFCYETAAKCAQLQFAILYNHDHPLQERVQKFLDIQ